jgi:hypothetical protein
MAWIALVVVVLVVAALGVVLIAPTLARTAAARRDYRQARGTLHRVEIERALAALGRRVEERQSERGRLEATVQADQNAEQQELDRALAEHLVDTRLDDVPGVGRTRVAAIKEGVFRGSLRDLLAADAVPGIGPQTAVAIAAWVQQLEREWDRLRADPFPGRQVIESEHATRRRTLLDQKAAVERELAALDVTRAAAQTALDRLKSVTAATFRRALATPIGGQEELRSYLLGVFPPWGKPPRWYLDLLAVERGVAVG